jgi:hypothetical protein
MNRLFILIQMLLFNMTNIETKFELIKKKFIRKDIYRIYVYFTRFNFVQRHRHCKR